MGAGGGCLGRRYGGVVEGGRARSHEGRVIQVSAYPSITFPPGEVSDAFGTGWGVWLPMAPVVAALSAGRLWPPWAPVAALGAWLVGGWLVGNPRRRRLFLDTYNLHDFNYTRPAAQRFRGWTQRT